MPDPNEQVPGKGRHGEEGHSSFVLDLAEDRTLQVECGLILSCLRSFTTTGNESLEVSALVWN